VFGKADYGDGTGHGRPTSRLEASSSGRRRLWGKSLKHAKNKRKGGVWGGLHLTRKKREKCMTAECGVKKGERILQ